MIEIQECKRAGYPARTEENVIKSDVTLAFAVDFSSRGEQLTKSLCKKHSKLYVPIDLNNLILDSKRFKPLAEHLIKNLTTTVSVNVAGNGIYTLPESQTFYNEWFTQFFQFYSTLTRRDFETNHVRSGGQSGADEAGVIGASNMGYYCKVLAPKGWVFRGKDHRDIADEKLFKQRFNEK